MVVEQAVPLEETGTKRKHSKLGRVSLITAVCNFLIMVALAAGIVIGGEIHAGNRNEDFFLRLSDSCFIIFLYYIFSAAPLLFIVGLILGVTGAFRAPEKKGMSVAGLILNALFLIMTVILDIAAVLFYIGLRGLAPR